MVPYFKVSSCEVQPGVGFVIELVFNLGDKQVGDKRVFKDLAKGQNWLSNYKRDFVMVVAEHYFNHMVKVWNSSELPYYKTIQYENAIDKTLEFLFWGNRQNLPALCESFPKLASLLMTLLPVEEDSDYAAFYQMIEYLSGFCRQQLLVPSKVRS